MLKKSATAFLSLVFGLNISAAFAAETCSPEKLTASVDRFFSDPYGAPAWRQLHGLGTPTIEASSVDYMNWQSIDAWKKYVSEIAPEITGAQDAGYDCRMNYPWQVLQKRVADLGKDSAYIKQWLRSQSVVLAACGNTQNSSTDLPPPLADLKPELSALQADDRAYQTASIAFYKDKPAAIELFKAIANSNSPHKAYAKYNVANLLANNKDVVAARAKARAILADASLAPVHAITQELLGYISNIEDTPAGWTDLIDSTIAVLSKPEAEIMASEKLKTDYGRALYDLPYAGVTTKQDDWWIKGELPENPTLSKAVADVARTSPMALWIMTSQSVNANYDRLSWAMIGDKWNGWTSSYVDRAMALTPAATGITGLSKDVVDALKATSDEASRAKLWAEAKAAADAVSSSCGVAPEAAALGPMLTYAVRLSALANKFDEIYAGLDAMPIKATQTYQTNVVYKLAQYILATGNVEEGRRLRDKVLNAAFFSSGTADQQQRLKSQFSDYLAWVAEDQSKWDAALTLSDSKLESTLFNLLPAKTLAGLASDDQFSATQKALLLRAAWTRDYARGLNPDSTAMLAANPQIKAEYELVQKAFPKLAAKRQWQLTILRQPRFNILVNSPDSYEAMDTENANFSALDGYDHNDKNWWCPLETGRQMHALRQSFDAASGVDLYLDYHQKQTEPVYDAKLAEHMATAREKLLRQHPMVKAINTKEVRALEKIASAPANLTRAALSWGKSSTGTDGAPEALALAVKATHYGCSWHGGHKAYSKPAQELLQSKFGSTQWAKDTPYWFDCMEMVYDKDFNKVASCKPHQWPKDSLPK